MKKVILLLLMNLITMSTFAQQNVYARMFSIISGNVKTIVYEMSGDVNTFDKEGRLVSCKNGINELRYSWNGNKIKVSAYQDGKKLGEEYMTVSKNTPQEISITLPGGIVTETYRPDGAEDKSVIKSNGATMEETCYYHSDSDKHPYKYTISLQGQTETFELSGYQYDSYGNWIKRTVRNNGVSQTEIRTITYYN